MKVLLVTGFTPAVENIRGVSAHPYFLLKYRPSDVEVYMITYDINQMGSEYIQQLGKDLSIKIYKEEVPTKIRLLNNRLCNFLSPRGIYDLPQIRSESVCSNQFNCYACVRHQIEANDALVMPL